MTTRIHIVNFGPGKVEAKTSITAPPTEIWPNQYADFYVFAEQNVTVSEAKLATIESPQSLPKV